MRGTRYLVLVCFLLALFCVTAPSASAQPSLSLKPPVGPAGSAVTVSGSGFCGTCAGATIQFNDVPLASGVPVDGDGRFTTTVHVPADAATGPAQIIAWQRLSNGSTISTVALFTVTVPLLGGAGDASTPNSSVSPVRTTPIATSTAAASSTTVAPAAATTAPVLGTYSPSALATISASARASSSGPSTSIPLSSLVDAPDPATTDESMVIQVHSHAGRVLATWLGSVVVALLAGGAAWSRVRPRLRLTLRRH